MIPNPWLLLVGVIMAGALWWQAERIEGLRVDLRRAEQNAQIANDARDQALESARVSRAHHEREAQARAVLESELRDLRTQDGYDAPLDPFLSDVLDRL